MMASRNTLQGRTAGLDDLVRTFPAILDKLKKSYEELEARAERVDLELCRANEELERKVRELDTLKRHLEAVLHSLPCGVVVRDGKGTIVDLNEAAQSILGVDAEALTGEAEHAALQGEAADGQPRELSRGDGSRLVLASSYSPVRMTDGELDGSVEILDDRTERFEMTERLHAADKMAALGTMAAGIAHEIRNPLNAVKGFAALLLREPDHDEKTSRWCRLIVDGAAEADQIIENMLSFGSPQRLRMEAIEGEELLAGALRMALPEGSERVAVSTRCSAPAFEGDRIKLRQAIRNLVANAVEAQQEDPRVEATLLLEGQEIVLRVGDAGPGVPAELRNRVFDPFYTNHADGTGLGLALVAAIARLHGGNAWISPDPSALGGAEFLIRFPFRPARPPAVLTETSGQS